MQAAVEVLQEALQRDVRPATSIVRALQTLQKGAATSGQEEGEWAWERAWEPQSRGPWTVGCWAVWLLAFTSASEALQLQVSRRVSLHTSQQQQQQHLVRRSSPPAPPARPSPLARPA